MTLQVLPLRGIPEVSPGDDLAGLLLASLAPSGVTLQDGDILAVTHKVVSKAEGALAPLPDEGPEARRRVVQSQAAAVLRRRGDLIIAQTRQGFVCANAGVDRSNVEPGWAILHPRDPDRSAHRLRVRIQQATGRRVAVVITDTFGRPFRRGLTDVAIGLSGMPAVLDLRGRTDSWGRTLEVTEVAVADEVAAAADLVMGKASGIPAAVVRGLEVTGDGRAADLVRPVTEDLFR